MTDPTSINDLFYGDCKNPRPMVGLEALVLYDFDAKLGVDGVWFVPFREDVGGEEGVAQSTTFTWTRYDDL